MNFDSIWFLMGLPAAFALGWLASRLDLRQLRTENRSAPKAYFKGLNHLLNEQQDQAIDAFIEAVQKDPETSELHFALGNLFRRRGETERAIRMHQNLLDLPDVEEKHRLHAMIELGQDFLRAGLLDRAEEIFNRLQDTPQATEAKRYLLEIYQLGKEWQKAIDLARELPEIASPKEVAEYYCELAAGDIMRSRSDAAREHLAAALRENRNCVRANVLLGDLLAQEGQTEAAIATWQRVEQQDPDYLSLLAHRLLEAYRKLDRRAEGVALLRGYLEHYPSLDLIEVVYQLVLECEGTEAAYRLVQAELQRHPSLVGLEKLMSARLPLATPDSQGDLELARTIIQNYTRRLSRYRCNHCGFKARQYYWRCPACGDWESTPPRRNEEFDQNL